MDPHKMLSGTATCDDVMQCFFNLNDLEITLYTVIASKGPQRLDALAKKVRKDKTTVYRALQKLVSCGLCFKGTKTIKRGGYYHIYGAVDPKLVKRKLEDCMDRWNTNMTRALKDFDERFAGES
jgi:predicted transcriptional regulator